MTGIANQRTIIGSSLTAVELSGLTRVGLAFALLLAAEASGLTLGLGLHERRRTFAIARALGARPRQLGGLRVERIGPCHRRAPDPGWRDGDRPSIMLLKVLTEVFDPPPDVLSVRWLYLSGVASLTIVAVGAGGALTLHSLRRPAMKEPRDP